MKNSEGPVINHEGIVKENSGNSVKISFNSSSACSGCHAKGSCNMLGTEEKHVEVNGIYDVKPGDAVTILMKQSMGYSALFLGYILPFLLILTMLITLVSFKVPELMTGLISLAILLPYYSVLYIFRKRVNEKFTFTIKV